jgi:L-asparagine transporter-like permease
MWLFPWATYFAIAAMVAVLVKMALDPKMASEFWASAGSIAVALIAYLIKSRVKR